MLLDDLKNDIVLIKIRNHEELTTFGIRSPNIYAKVIEVDERLGIWVENPRWKPQTDSKTDESHLTRILLKWEHIVGIMTFPEREGYKEDEEIKPIGFVP
jgi:hypothetical protein